MNTVVVIVWTIENFTSIHSVLLLGGWSAIHCRHVIQMPPYPKVTIITLHALSFVVHVCTCTRHVILGQIHMCLHIDTTVQ